MDLADALSKALGQLQAGDIAGAHAACQRLLEQAPKAAPLHQLAAAIALQGDDPGGAKRWAESALALRPDHAPTLIVAGRAARALGADAEALDRFQRAMKAAPARSEAAFMTCVCLVERGDPRAQELLAHCLKTFPDDAPGWAAVGAALQELKQPEAALADLTRAARLAPSFELQMRRGAALIALGRVVEAIAAFEAAQDLQPASSEAALQIGLALRQLGDHAGARGALDRATQLDPGAARGWFALGLTAQDMRDWPAAANAYRAALAAQPDFAEAAVNLGVALQEGGDLEAAKEAYGRALALRADAFGRVAQALSAAPRGELWLDQRALRQSLSG